MPSGHVTAVADISDAGCVIPVAAALPPFPVLQFNAGAPRLADLAELPIIAAFRATAFINRDPRAFSAEAMSAKLLVVRAAGVVAGAGAGAGAGAAEVSADARHFALLWETGLGNFPLLTSFSRLDIS